MSMDNKLFLCYLLLKKGLFGHLDIENANLDCAPPALQIFLTHTCCKYV